MLPLLKKKKLSNNQCELHLWGLWSFASLRFVSPVTEAFREAQMLPGMVSMQGGLCWSQCERCFRVAAVISCVLPMQGCVPFLSAVSWLPRCIVKGIAGVITLLCFPGAYSMYVWFPFLLLWDSALSCTLSVVFPNWGCLRIESVLIYHQHSLSVLESTPCARGDLWLGTSRMH